LGTLEQGGVVKPNRSKKVAFTLLLFLIVGGLGLLLWKGALIPLNLHLWAYGVWGTLVLILLLLYEPFEKRFDDAPWHEVNLVGQVHDIAVSQDFSRRIPGSRLGQIDPLTQVLNLLFEQFEIIEERMLANFKRAEADRVRLEELHRKDEVRSNELEARTQLLHKALERQQELSELKIRFISMVSHEFRTPLASMLSATEVLLGYSDRLTDEQKMERLYKIRNQVVQLIDLMEEVLFVGQAQAGKLEFVPTELDPVLIIEETVDDFRNLDPAGAMIRFSVEGTDRAAKLDKKHYLYTVRNLIGNALKYSSEGTHVDVVLRLKLNFIELQVTNTGIGIPKEDLDRLFEPFHRASNVGNISGTGLGLAIIRESLDQHGGTITVDSEMGGVTCFTVRIPRGLSRGAN
jgi:signal transduction histidine kinase